MNDDNVRITDSYNAEDLKWAEGLAEHFKLLVAEVLYENGIIENDPNEMNINTRTRR